MAEGRERGIIAPGTGAVRGRSGAKEERCIHGFPGGKGCYLCDSEYPYRKGD